MILASVSVRRRGSRIGTRGSADVREHRLTPDTPPALAIGHAVLRCRATAAPTRRIKCYDPATSAWHNRSHHRRERWLFWARGGRVPAAVPRRLQAVERGGVDRDLARFLDLEQQTR